MKLKRILSFLLSAAVILTSLIVGAVPAGAASTGLTVSSTYKDGYYVLRLYGMTKKQYTELINNKSGFIVSIISEDSANKLFIASDLTKKCDEPAIKGSKTGYQVYAGIKGGMVHYSTWADYIGFSGLYGTAPGKTYGFQWKLDYGEKTIRDFLPGITKSPKVKVTFEDVLDTAPLKPGGLSSSKTLNASWGDVPLGFDLDGSTAVVTIPTENFYKYSGRKNAKLDLSLYFGIYEVSVEFTGGDSGFVYTALADGKDISGEVSVGGKFDKNGAAAVSFSFSGTAAKALSTEKITALYRVTEGGKLISGSNEKVTLWRGGTINISDLSFTKIEVQIYSGKELTPLPVIRDGYMKLIKGEDFTFSYKNNTKVGTATLTIKGKGDYSGTKKITFKIIPDTPFLKGKKNSDSKVTLTWFKVTGAEKYQLYKSENGGKYTLAATIPADKLSKTVANLALGENKYSFKLRALTKSGSKYVPGAWSNVITIE